MIFRGTEWNRGFRENLRRFWAKEPGSNFDRSRKDGGHCLGLTN